MLWTKKAAESKDFSKSIVVVADFLSVELVDNLIIRYMPSLLPEVNRSLSKITVPLFLGYTVDMDKIWVENEDNQHISVVGELIRLKWYFSIEHTNI